MSTLSLHPSGHAVRCPGSQPEQQAKLKLTITALFTYCDSASQEVKKKKKKWQQLLSVPSLPMKPNQVSQVNVTQMGELISFPRSTEQKSSVSLWGGG